MKTYNWTTFTKKIGIKANLSDLYDAWTQADKIETWFLSRAVYNRGEKPIGRTENVQTGDTYEWSWFLYDITDTAEITQANGTDFFQFKFAGDCLVDVSFKKENEYVIVELTQKNIPTDDESKRGIRLGCDSGWSFFMLNLKSVYEGGLDLRNKDTNLKGMLNC